MLDSYLISGGKAASCAFDAPPGQEIFLALCINPSEDEVSRISKKLGVSIEDIKDITHEDTSPRIGMQETYSAITYRAPYMGGARTITMPAAIFLSDSMVVAVFRSKMKSIETLITEIAAEKSPPIFKDGVPGIVACIFDRINDEFSDGLEEVGSRAEEFEKRLLHVLSREDAGRLHSLNMTLTYFQRALLGNREVLKELSGGEAAGFSGPKVKSIFSELQKDVIELMDAEEIQRSTINNIFALHSNMLTNELSVVMKQLTAIGAIILFPTFIAAIYGMNITGLPFAESRYGFHAISLILAFGAGAIALYFKKKGWI